MILTLSKKIATPIQSDCFFIYTNDVFWALVRESGWVAYTGCIVARNGIFSVMIDGSKEILDEVVSEQIDK